MSRFFVPEESVQGNGIIVTGKEAHHILDVMRLAVGDAVVAFDGTGREFAGVIRETGPKSLRIEITSTRAALSPSGVRISLFQSIPKKEKMEYIIEKATELGVAEIVPLMTARTIIRWDEAKRDKAADRWKKIAREASKQCGRSDVPMITEITGFRDAFLRIKRYDRALIAALSDKTMPLKKALAEFTKGSIAVFIGPEGDFTAQEVEIATQYGCLPISLGSRILKSDTAGLALLAILTHTYDH